MDTMWTPHRFSGEVLALDVANTVVLRHVPSRRFDRFEAAEEIVRFAQAASEFRAGEFGQNPLQVSDPLSARPRIVALREATDALFRDARMSGALSAALLSPLLGLCSRALAEAPFALASDGAGPASQSGPIELEAAIAVSALALLAPDQRRRIRICGNCGWLFLDRSRNGSRLWCDMTVCGNRQKARRHYGRSRAAREKPRA